MNTFRMISRVLVVAAVVFAGNACAKVTLKDFANASAEGIYDRKGNLLMIAVADEFVGKDNHALKAMLETAGVWYDVDPSTLTGKDLELAQVVVLNATANYSARKLGEYLASKGYTVKNTVGSALNKVPYVGEAISPVVVKVVEAAGPQFVASCVVGSVNAYNNKLPYNPSGL